MFAYSFLVLAECGMDHAHVEEDLASVANFSKLVESLFEFIVIVAAQGCHPSLDFL